MKTRLLAAAGSLLFGLLTVGFVLAQETPREERSEEARERSRGGDLYFRVSRLEQQVERLSREVAARSSDQADADKDGTPNKQSTAATELKIFTLENADAADVTQILQSLYMEGRENRFGGRRDDSFRDNIRVASDTRTNSVIVISDPERLRTIEAVLMKLDEKPREE